MLPRNVRVKVPVILLGQSNGWVIKIGYVVLMLTVLKRDEWHYSMTSAQLLIVI